MFALYPLFETLTLFWFIVIPKKGKTILEPTNKFGNYFRIVENNIVKNKCGWILGEYTQN